MENREPGLPGDHARVSVILPTYNSVEFVDRAIESVLAQDGPYLAELVVVDDSSSDGTVEFIRNLCDADPRIKLLSSDMNRGPGAARNRGIVAASGEWIALIDADDAWRPDRLARLMPLCSPGVDLLFDNLIAYDRARGVASGTMFPPMPDEMSVTAMVAERAPGTRFNYGYLKPLIRRSFLEQTGVSYAEVRISEDLLFYLELLIHRARTRVTAEAGYIYTTPIGSLSRRRSALSATVPDDLLVGSLLDELASRYKDRLTPVELHALRMRAERLRDSAPLSRLYDSWMRGQYLSVVQQCIVDAKVRRALLDKVGKRLSGRRN